MVSAICLVCAVVFFVLYWGNMIILTTLSAQEIHNSLKLVTPCKMAVFLTRLALTVLSGVCLVTAAILSILHVANTNTYDNTYVKIIS